MKNKILFCCFMLALGKLTAGGLNRYVDPLIGTAGHGHTFPGPVVPFGMIQPGPDTRLDGWDGCSGYHYSDSLLYGFSHTHLSGTGASDYCDILLQPGMEFNGWKNNQYAQKLSKERELASVGYYRADLQPSGIRAELTATARTGLHRYTFSRRGSAHVLLDLTHRDRVIASDIQITGPAEVSGKRFSHNWADNQQLYFVIQFSQPLKGHEIWKNGRTSGSSKRVSAKALKAAFYFDADPEKPLMLKIGISAVSVENARKNLEAEQSGFQFEEIRQKAVELWDAELSKIKVTHPEARVMRTFYTALYHAMIAPNLYMDVNGEYHGRDHKIHRAEGFDYYTVFSLWDTYRALHPLLTLVDRKRTLDFIQTFIHQFEEGGRLPVWELSACETWCMIGYHAVPVIAEAILRDIPGFDREKAYQAMRFSAMENKNALDSYKKNGYIYFTEGGQSVSRTLEYAYDDWCIAKAAEQLGKKEDAELFFRRAASWKALFDSTTGFMRPRAGGFLKPFDPYEVSHAYTEGNAWQYSFYVPHDLNTHMELMGGKAAMAEKLDSLFGTSSRLTGRQLPDITGLIGQYAHGNEPSHQIAYQYNYVGQPWKTQSMVRRIMEEMYSDRPDGLCGNEDCGQMSAWYLFSALGFYPVCPGSDQYVIGSPLFTEANIRLENGSNFSIRTENNSRENKYIQEAYLNGKSLGRSFLYVKEVMNGGDLLLKMGSAPNLNWGVGEGNCPVSRSR